MQVNNISEAEVEAEVARRSGFAKPASPARPSKSSASADSVSSADIAKVSAKFKRLIEALTAAYDALTSGGMPTATDLEDARKKLMEALATSELGTRVPLLQKFLRGAAVELISSLRDAGATLENLQPLWDGHMKTFAQAQAEATQQFAAESTSVPGNFWEASI